MAFCTFSDGAAMFDATPIENMFLIEYMYDAPAAALKVYLYARMLALHPEMGGSLKDMAKALRMDEEEVYAAFAYWESRDLVCRISDQPTYAFKPMRGSAAATALDREMYANRDFNNALRKLFGDKFIGDHELRKAGDWLNILKYEPSAALRMVEYGIQTSRSKDPKPPSVFKRMDKLAEAWSTRDIRTLEDVERAIAEENGEFPVAREVLKKLGIPRQPSDPELAAVRKWMKEWGYAQEDILAACDDTISARNPTIKYLDSILETRRAENPEAYRELTEVLRELNPKSAQPSPDQIKRYEVLRSQWDDPEMIRLAAVQCHRANKYHFDDLEWRLNTWREDGVAPPEAADEWMRQMSLHRTELRRVYRQAGIGDKRPSDGDIVAYRGWKKNYPEDLIQYAAECSKNAVNPASYMGKLLSGWAERGVNTVEAARAEHEARRTPSANPALDYAQREYRDEDFGDDFFVDLSKYGEEERK